MITIDNKFKIIITYSDLKIIMKNQRHLYAKQKIVGIRPGEKLHEQMIGVEDAVSTFEYAGHYKILPVINGWNADSSRIKEGTKVAKDFTYTSGDNEEWMSIEQLQVWLKENKAVIGKI